MSNQTFPLIPAEAEELQQLEATIAGRLASFIAVGEALSKIREGKLYRATHGTFEDYCRLRWGMSRYYAHRLIESADVVEMLPVGNKSDITTESQARELAKVEPMKRAEVIERSREMTGGKITAAALKAAANPDKLVIPDMYERHGSEVAPAATGQAAAWSLPRFGDRLRLTLAHIIDGIPAEHRAEAKWLAAKIAAEVFAPSDTDEKPAPWGPKNVIPPLPEWVTAYSASIGYPLDGEAWCDAYQVKGWKIKGQKVVDWQACVRTWKKLGYGVGGIALAQPKMKPIMR